LSVRLRIAVLAIALMCGACERNSPLSGNGSPAAPPRAATVFGSGTIRGTVKFIGTPPPREVIPNKPCHEGAGPLKDETVVVNDDSTLANVFVYLADAPASDGSPRDVAVLDQKDCHYVPHAVGVQVGQKLAVKSSDAGTLHNVHYSPEKNPPANFAETVAGASKDVMFDQPEFIRVKCDVHPWMSATVGVFESPFFAVTREGNGGGGFEIAKVPAGQYKLVAWHERYGAVEQQVTVKDNEKTDVTMSFKQE
jgi:plastocyanin